MTDNKTLKKDETLKNFDVDENQSSQDSFGDIFNSEDLCDKHQSEEEFLVKHSSDNDLMHLLGAEASTNLYDDFTEHKTNRENSTEYTSLYDNDNNIS